MDSRDLKELAKVIERIDKNLRKIAEVLAESKPKKEQDYA